MIKNITLTGLQFEFDERTKKYINRKVGSLDRYMSRHARKSATAEVVIRQVDQSNGNKYEAEVIIRLPEQTIVAKDTTLNVLAAIDIVEAKIITQLRRYREQRVAHRGRHALLAKFKRSFARES